MQLKNTINATLLLLLYSFFLICIQSCDPVDDDDNDDDDIMREWETDNPYLGLWRLSTVERLDCTISSDNIVDNKFSSTPCQSDRSGFCFYTTLCLLPNGKYIFEDQVYDEFEQTFGETGTYMITDETITFCISGGTCKSPREYMFLRNSSTGQISMSIKDSGSNFGNSTCAFIRTYHQIEDISHSAVSYFSFDDTTDDLFGQANVVREEGGIKYVLGKQGQAAYFNGKDDKVIYDKEDYALDGNVSVSCWILDEEDDGSSVFIFNGDFSCSVSQFNTGLSVPVSVTNQRAVRTEIDGRIWNHIAGTSDGSTLKLYINGALAETRELEEDIIDVDLPLTIGAGSTDNYWTGLLDELYIFDRVLTASEIRSLYEK